uniref:Uncharacterized protein n=1 Tax=Vitis vinifera TaxID=29760 RepID=F6HI34_VITVI
MKLILKLKIFIVIIGMAIRICYSFGQVPKMYIWDPNCYWYEVWNLMFETEESGKRRYLGTTVGISDLDPLSWADCLVGNFSTSQDVQSQITSLHHQCELIQRFKKWDQLGGQLMLQVLRIMQNYAWQLNACLDLRVCSMTRNAQARNWCMWIMRMMYFLLGMIPGRSLLGVSAALEFCRLLKFSR